MTAQPGRLRIIGGSHRGHRIEIPTGSDARPTGNRVREALFNILMNGLAEAPQLPGARVLDACAGSGALGIEALSRGAAACCFVDDGLHLLGEPSSAGWPPLLGGEPRRKRM